MSRRTSFSYSRIECLNDPERPTSLANAVDIIVEEEQKQKVARRQARWLPAIPLDPCGISPSGAHWWTYPPQGVRGSAVCRHCGMRPVQNARNG